MTVKTLAAATARALAEEVNRADATPVTECRIYEFLAANGYGDAEIAELTGTKTRHMIQIRRSLGTLIEPAREDLTNGALPVGPAWYVARLSEVNQRVMVMRYRRGDFADWHAASDTATAIWDDEQAARNI